MVVDDEPGIRTALRANFLRNGWTVDTASCVREAIRSVENREYDLVVTDIRMPDGSGMEVMKAARNACPSTAVILLTAYGSVPDAVERHARWGARLPHQADSVRSAPGHGCASDELRKASAGGTDRFERRYCRPCAIAAASPAARPRGV